MQPEDFFYDLPEHRIAQYPLQDRASSRFLVWKQGKISHHQFRDLPQISDGNIQLVFNDTRVIPARIFFQRATGATIEVFLLEPVEPSPLVQLAMQAKGFAVWKTLIGNLKKWKDGEILLLDLPGGGQLKARLLDRENRLVSFEWNPSEWSWYQVLEQSGKIPIPPYLNRESEESDAQSYQTVYARQDGAVAAPTAGLHFTPEVLEALRVRNTGIEYLTLHVSAGTFMPMTQGDIRNHVMHQEQMVFNRTTLEALANDRRHRVAVGTTSLRSLESLYWYGVLLTDDPDSPFFIPKLLPYQEWSRPLPNRRDSLLAVLEKMDRENMEELGGITEIFILPGYKPRNTDSLITNFHQPGSTLIVLIEALVGKAWRDIYRDALEQEYRFLSYGDSSWLIW